mgnify:FL=1
MQTTYYNLKYRIIYHLIIIGNSFIFLFGIVNILLGNPISAAVELMTGIGGYISLYVAYKKHKPEISSYILLGFYVLMCWYLFFSGGIKSTGILWLYTIPMVSFFLMGTQKGLCAVSLFFSVIFVAALLYFQKIILLPYTHSFLLMFLVSSGVLTVLMYLIDRLRENAEMSLKNKISEVETLNKKLEYYSFYDTLTGIFNRRQIISLLEKEFERYKRTKNKFCVILLDLDFFKKINDTYGHLFGDTVLKETIQNIQKEILRKSDSIGRYGGEEFLIIMPETSENGAYIAAERIREYTASHKFLLCNNLSVFITISLGISEIAEDDTIDKLLHKSDIALYEAKRNGRNRTEMFNSSMML